MAVEQIVGAKQRHARRARAAEVVGDIPEAEEGAAFASGRPLGDGGIAARAAGALEEAAQRIEGDHQEQAG